MRVLCLVPYPTLGASNRLRVEQYAVALRAYGIHLEVSPFLDDRTYRVLYRHGHAIAKARGVLDGFRRRVADVLRARRYDVVLVHREAAPIGPPFAERLLCAMSIPLVFDFDDAIFLGPVHPANRRWAWLRHPSRVAETARLAKVVIVGNEYLAAWVRRWNSQVFVIPTPVDADRHRPVASRGHLGRIVMGWIGSSTTAPYLRLLDRPLALLAERHDFVFRVIGGEYAHSRAKVEIRPYDLEREARDLQEFDIGVLPEPDDPWTRGKGAFKALLYMATAVPVVASRVGVNEEVVVDGVAGYCVTTDEEWVVALERLMSDPQLRSRLGDAGRRRVEERFSVTVQALRLAAALQAAVERDRTGA